MATHPIHTFRRRIKRSFTHMLVLFLFFYAVARMEPISTSTDISISYGSMDLLPFAFESSSVAKTCQLHPKEIGTEFQVNTEISDKQWRPSVTSLSPNSPDQFVISWASYSQDAGSQAGIYAQIFDGPNSKVGTEFQVNTKTDKNQNYPSVSALLNGDQFVVTWESQDQGGGLFGIFAQIFDGPNSKVGSEFQVNTNTDKTQNLPSVASSLNGGTQFVITWQSNHQDGDFYGIYAQIFDGSNSKVGSEFHVNTNTTGNKKYPSVGYLSNTSFVISWQGEGQDGDGLGIYAQIFDGPNSKVGSEFLVNTHTAGHQHQPSIASLGSKDASGHEHFIITWYSNAQDGDEDGVYAQIFNSDDGSKVGSEFQVNTHTTSAQQFPSVASLGSKDAGGHVKFIITWHSNLQDGNLAGIFAQLFNFSGDGSYSKIGSEFQVNTHTDDNQRFPSVAALGSNDASDRDNFVITWESNLQDTSKEGIFCQAFDSNTLTECPCDPGTYLDQPDVCLYCPTGTYQDQANETSCKNCPTGTHSNTTGADSFGVCSNCTAGSYSDSEGSMYCTQCQAGQYQDKQAQTACLYCTAGTYSANEGSPRCVACTEGSYGFKKGAISYEDGCKPCPRGTWSNHTGLDDLNECTKCAAGFFNVFTGSSSIDQCYPCNPGTYSEYQGMSSRDDCTQCEDGKYSNETHSTSCSLCPVGYEPNDVQDQCVECPKGYYRNSSTIDLNCAPCPLDYFNQEKGATYCFKCGFPNTCIGEGKCALGRDPSSFCSRCVDGYFLKNAECKQCSSKYWIIFWILLIVITILFIYRFRKKIANLLYLKKNPIFEILITFFQLLAGVLSMNIKWPLYIDGGIISANSLFNFDISAIFRPGCYQKFDFYSKYLIMVLFPLALLALSLLVYLIFKIMELNAFKKKIGINWDRINAKYCNLISLAFRYLYIPEIIICTQPMQTTWQEGIKKHVLDYYPTIATEDEKYQKYYPWFWFFFIFYALVIPIAYAIILIISKKKHFSEYWYKRFGWLWDFYKPNRFWWEIVKLIFRFLILLIPLFISSSSSNFQIIQLVLLIGIILIMIILTLSFRPFPYFATQQENPPMKSPELRSLWEKISPEDVASIGLNIILIAIVSSGITQTRSIIFFIFYPVGVVTAFMGTRKNFKQMWIKNKKRKKKAQRDNNKLKSDPHANSDSDQDKHSNLDSDVELDKINTGPEKYQKGKPEDSCSCSSSSSSSSLEQLDQENKIKNKKNLKKNPLTSQGENDNKKLEKNILKIKEDNVSFINEIKTLKKEIESKNENIKMSQNNNIQLQDQISELKNQLLKINDNNLELKNEIQRFKQEK
ncbi:insulin-like growth factor binding proteinn-terminal [Anaeramoeba flamelloides]|uniref:Insulin-like growth factor binding proteinn-terminal n=1 Tax=Anaeramoeba flamelloides TaxID=1746091 RepID=A0AAV7ZPC7_9EUKA|nr:insulin-like growth factor binding proteinn-terminal [Anaeramoeba flamelloides]